MWFKRFIKTMIRGGGRSGGSLQEQRISALLGHRSEYHSSRLFLSSIIDALPAEEELEDATISRITRTLRGAHADRSHNDDDELADQCQFWFRLSYNFPESAYARACYADALATVGDSDASLAHFADAFDAKPALLFEFGSEVYDIAKRAGGDVWLRYQLACLRAALDQGEAPDEDDDFVRELYSELLEEYRQEPEAMRRILHIGAQLRDLEAEDRLPRAIVRRGAWRK